MAMESSIFPVPSEIVIPPAAFLAAQGKLSFRVMLAGTFGSYLGSAVTYWVSRLAWTATDREVWPLHLAHSEQNWNGPSTGWLVTKQAAFFLRGFLPVSAI